jgi:hypothetical protein
VQRVRQIHLAAAEGQLAAMLIAPLVEMHA